MNNSLHAKSLSQEEKKKKRLDEKLIVSMVNCGNTSDNTLTDIHSRPETDILFQNHVCWLWVNIMQSAHPGYQCQDTRQTNVSDLTALDTATHGQHLFLCVFIGT